MLAFFPPLKVVFSVKASFGSLTRVQEHVSEQVPVVLLQDQLTFVQIKRRISQSERTSRLFKQRVPVAVKVSPARIHPPKCKHKIVHYGENNPFQKIDIC